MDTPTTGREARTAPRRLIAPDPHTEAPCAGAEPAVRPMSLVASAARFGLATGFVELAILQATAWRSSGAAFGELQLNRNFTWMIPAAHLAIALACILPPLALVRFRPKIARRVATILLCTVSILSLLLMLKGLYAIAAGVLAAGLAWKAAPLVEAGGRRYRRATRLGLPIMLAGVAILGGLSYNRLVLAERRAIAGLPAAAPGAPNVLLIVLDTVRADRLSVHGYERDTTPNLAKLARRGVVFGQARSTAPWTLPSHASMFTGRWPSELGVDSNRPLPEGHPTLAGYLSQHGYATGGFVGNMYFCNSWFGLGRGFAHYEDYFGQSIMASPAEALACTAIGRRLARWSGGTRGARPDAAKRFKPGDRVNADFLRWMADVEGRPFFAFLNFVDAHDPYETPPSFTRRFGVRPESAADIETIRWWFVRDKHTITPRHTSMVRDAYDDCLAYLDEELGRLFDELDRRGTLANTLVIVTSDHGEGFGEHGLYLHGQSLYNAEVHVPLLVVAPSAGVPAGRTVGEGVSLRDLAATVVDQLGLAAGSPFPGQSLARFWRGAEGAGPTTEAPVYSEAGVAASVDPKTRAAHARRVSTNAELPPALRGPMASLLSEGMLYIRDALGHEELYDLPKDPAESKNLAGDEAARPALDRLRAAFDRVAPSGPPREDR